ncbi:Stage 0 sporulation protein KD [Sedimentisphaera cyanobacteriorum]|uniref:Stage 0 sporulation protein KD n=1 Tax=Sedimentisphaera cyanobacteriorum TaxID=1940790 RepID=A0A1Q2HNB9_9BACT|nr:ABC transporter ATP-binding protein [Sedimentisphaera cyanobacteriorum]AQQ08967.1 Stage 0 sporulation protein KD [Sedimentisphaera cyanobacteriorum]
MSKQVLKIDDLYVSFYTDEGEVKAVSGLTLDINEGETVALVGESGCGKSVSSLSVLGLLPNPPAKIKQGEILYKGQNLLNLEDKQLRTLRGSEIAMIFQEPMTSLNPVYTIGDQIIETILAHEQIPLEEAEKRAAEMLGLVGIPDPLARLDEYPHQLSGGMRQRVMIAMALSCRPSLLIADEPTTALDVTVQAQILELLKRIQSETNMSILLITHDLGVVAENADRVVVMYASKVVEKAGAKDIFDSPKHPYTKGLMQSLPKLGEKRGRLDTIKGAVPDPLEFPSGCKFHPRCPLGHSDLQCIENEPQLEPAGEERFVSCWKWQDE